jgi:2-polyprenyl-3-methyl-5-hydroxy-6-metoxy-1,4-benzoquinol methylase
METPWQLKMFRKSLKKNLKVKALSKHFGSLEGKQCLLVTCGDNNGATNFHLKQMGGRWTWADFEDTCILEMEELLQEKVHLLQKAEAKFPFPDESFDLVVCIDVHEHLAEPIPVTKELYRIVRQSGKVVVTTPNGNEKKLAVRIKHLVGMTAKKYGHMRVGFDVPELERLLRDASLHPYRASSYSKFFTEMVELAINFAYVKVLSKKSKARVEEGTIAPTTREQLESVQRSYKLYAFAYPFFWTISQFDRLLFFTRGYAVIVEANR